MLGAAKKMPKLPMFNTMRIVELVVFVLVVLYVYHFVYKIDCELVKRYDRINPYVELVLVVLLVTFVGTFSPFIALAATAAYVASIFRYYKVCGGRKGVYWPHSEDKKEHLEEDGKETLEIKEKIEELVHGSEPSGVDRYGYDCVKGCCDKTGGSQGNCSGNPAQNLECPIQGFSNVDLNGSPLF